MRPTKDVEKQETAACIQIQVACMPPKRDSNARVADGMRVWLKLIEPWFHTLMGPIFVRDRHVKGYK